MLDDLRDHDPNPSHEECGWMRFDATTAAIRALVLLGVSLMIGVGASYFISPDASGDEQVASRAASR